MAEGMASGTQEAQQAVFNDRVRNVYMQRERQLGIQIRFAQFLFFAFLRFWSGAERRKIAQRRRDIVLVRVADLNAGILLRRLLFLSRCEKPGSEQCQKNAGGKQKKYQRETQLKNPDCEVDFFFMNDISARVWMANRSQRGPRCVKRDVTQSR